MSGAPPSSGLACQVWRQVLKKPDLEFPAQGITASPGDFIEAALIRLVQSPDRGRLGPGITRPNLEKRFKVSIDDTQLIFRPAQAAPERPLSPRAVSTPHPVVVCRLKATESPSKTIQWALDKSRNEDVLLLDPEVLCPLGEEALGRLLANTMAKTGARCVFPAMNLSEPTSLPMIGDSGSMMTRLPGGRSVWEIAEILAKSNLAPVRACPNLPGAALLTRQEATLLAFEGGWPLNATDSVTDPRAFVYRDNDKSSLLMRHLDTQGGASNEWPAVSGKASQAASAPHGRPPVVFYSANVGPWGGVAVIFRLADELQRLGLHALVVHRTTTPHAYRPLTSPLKVRSSAVLAEDWARLVGDEDSILVASHWASGKACQEVARKNPKIVLTSILQDREDMFETQDKKPIPRKIFQDYLDIGRGASVSRWILDTAAVDLGLDLTNYRVIPNGIDLDVFKPKFGPGEEPPTNSPIRILAMWRPQTAIRRGIALLRETYDRLHAKYGSKIDLTVMGWDSPQGAGKAPRYVRHLGHLSPAGVAEAMASADIVTEPSLFQGWSLQTQEGLACGAAVVSTDCLGPRDFLRHEENGLLVPHAELFDSIVRVIEDDALRLRLRRAARPSVSKMSWERIGAMWALFLTETYAELGAGRWRDEFRAIDERATKILETSC